MSDISFKKLQMEDLPLLHQWLNEPHVIEWYEKKPSTMEDVRKKYLPRIAGDDATKSFFIIVDDQPIGYIQSYFVDDDPEIKSYVPKNSAGLDLFIGETSHLGRGLGSEILREFLKQVVFQQEGIEHCVVDPLPTNPRMIHVIEKAGFKYLVTINGKEPKYLMIIDKML